MESNTPSERVYVSGLQPGMTKEKMTEIFGPYGTLKEAVMVSGNSACILVFASLDEAQWLVDNMDGNMPEGISTPLKVKFANRPANAAPAMPTFGAGAAAANRPGPYGQATTATSMVFPKASIQMLKQNMQMQGRLPTCKTRRPDHQLCVKNLPPDTTAADLCEIFAPFGAISFKGCRALLDASGNCTGVGFVDFIEESSAKAAARTLDGFMSPGSMALRVLLNSPAPVKNPVAKPQAQTQPVQPAQAAAKPAQAKPQAQPPSQVALVKK
eukprot:CAMPEP_0171069682 /NCGR_PEP_ID=MMETSP0766_2-20121228/9298_1 /TAXON_ID=439317 /ORGANISM="Gambierdiscus australes, Strain CAWD 149" /LENGTH=269 /DNA_ID=CAMNT_0011526091 /DNA_START=55 /DNA_END=864 /DNA_ORIENTATION=+